MSQKRFMLLFSVWLLCLVFLAALALTPAGVARASYPIEVIASGLNNPRGLTFGPDGTLYVAEAGTGGDGSDGRCFDGPEGEVCYGATGAVTRVLTDGTQERVVSDMASLASPVDGGGGVGPNDVAVAANGDLYVIVGLGADPAVRDPGGVLGADGMNLGQLAMVSGGTWSNVMDVAGYESVANPDGGEVDSNPFALIPQGGGGLAVTDAGGNSLLSVVVESRSISTLSVFPTRTVEFPPGSGQMVPMQAVPTGVIEDGNGDFLVGELTGFPFPLGGANVYGVLAGGGDPTMVAGGFTNILDVALGDDGSLFVLEMATNSLLTGDPTGAIQRVYPDGTRETVTTGLFLPTGMTMGPDGMLYVSNYGPLAGAGQVVRVDPNAPTDVSVSGFGGEQTGGSVAGWLVLGLLVPAGAWLIWRRRAAQDVPRG